jgi:hypothetical protein
MSRREKLDMNKISDEVYLFRWANILCDRYPKDAEFGMILGYMVGKIDVLLDPKR